jgi:hypothetical protein
MRRTLVGVLFLLVPLAWSASAQQSSQTTIDHLIITDKQAVEEWSKATQGQQPLDPGTPLETEFLLSLSPTERLGAFRFKQRCLVCHGRQMSLQPNTWGPILTRKNVEGREDVVRRQIMEGSPRMPAFKYSLQPSDVEAIVQYLKRVDTVPM